MSAYDTILGKLEGVRRSGNAHVARCPAHEDRRPSLSITPGRTGVLLKCWAGCTVRDIASALGLSLADLFDDTRRTERPRTLSARPDGAQIRSALDSELQAIRADLSERGIEGELLSGEINAARRRTAVRLNVSLAPIPAPLSEGCYGGRDRDPAWQSVFSWALDVSAMQIVGARVLPEQPPHSVLILAEQIAGWAMRGLEREARPQPVRRAA